MSTHNDITKKSKQESWGSLSKPQPENTARAGRACDDDYPDPISHHNERRKKKQPDDWNNFLSDMQTELDKVFAQQWVKTANHKGIAAIDAVYEHYTTLGSPKGKDDKWYFEARQNHGKVEVNLDRLTEEQAVKKMEEGKDIMTLDKALAKKVITLFKNGGSGRVGSLKVEKAHHNHQKTDGHYDHMHYGRNADERLHCWIWKNT